MKTMKKVAIAILFSVLCAVSAFGSDTERERPRGGHQGPPPEAYTACEGKSDGDTAEFVSPRGDTVTGTCEMDGDRLVLRPDNPRPGGRGMKRSND